LLLNSTFQIAINMVALLFGIDMTMQKLSGENVTTIIMTALSFAVKPARA